MRIAVFSDVHSNLPALESVLDDIEATGVDARYVLGDLVGYAPWPNETLERLRAESFPIVMGNYDDGTGFDRDDCGCAYVKERDKAEGDAGFAWTKAHTSDENKAWLRTLRPQIRFEIRQVRGQDPVHQRWFGRQTQGRRSGACWALVDTSTGSLEFRRVAYDVERAAQAIEASELPPAFRPSCARRAAASEDVLSPGRFVEVARAGPARRRPGAGRLCLS